MTLIIITIIITDLLADGMTNGQVVRLMLTPYRRKVEEQEAVEENAAETTSNKADEKQEKGSNASNKAESEHGGQESEGQHSQEEAHSGEVTEAAAPEPIPTRNWYNMVCYGVPNLIITQLSKQ